MVSPDKKSYTELQSKSKKSSEEISNKKYPGESRKSLPDQTGGVISQQMAGGAGAGAGYLQGNEMMYSEAVRPHQHHQDHSMGHRQTRASYNSGYPGSSRQYSSSSSTSSASSSHYPYQAVQHHSNLQPYHHPYNHDSHHSSGKYSCSAAPHSSSYIHSDFHSRNYYSPTKNYPSSSSSASNVASYRNFNSNELCPVLPPEPFNYKRSSSSSMVAPSNQQMAELTQQIPAGDKTVPTTSSGTFSVTHLVNSNQRKGSKRTSTGSSKAAKQQRTEAGKEGKTEKEEGKRTGRSGSSRRNKSGSRSNYSAESLISSSGGGGGAQTMLATTASPCKNQNTKVNQNAAIKSSANWSNDINHFSGLQLSSLSPSPANLFPTDLSSIDFQTMSLFPSDPTSLQPPPAQNTKTSSKQPAACQVVTNQRSSATVPDWTLNTGGLLDPGFLPPIPTLTPPSDPMTDPMSGYTFMSPMSHSHSAGFYPTCAQSGSRNQAAYSAHSAANISVSGYSSQSKTTNAGHNSFPPSQMVSLPPSQTGSLVNFNLSTIFPEINIAPGSQNSLMVPPSLVFSNNPEQQQ